MTNLKILLHLDDMPTCFLSFLLSTELKLLSIHNDKNKTPARLILKLQICQNKICLLL